LVLQHHFHIARASIDLHGNIAKERLPCGASLNRKPF
jgi:hypothetical protein